jgi:hypothetical protein
MAESVLLQNTGSNAWRLRSLWMVILIFWAPLFTADAQSLLLNDPFADEDLFHVGSSLIGSTGDGVPFWMHSNVNGRVDPSENQWLNEVAFRQEVVRRGDFRIRGGAHLLARLSDHSSIHASQLYLQGSYRGWRVRGGRFEQPIGLNNHRLSAGSMMVSHNASPIPRIALETDGYLNVPGTQGVVQFSAMFSHGWFEENRHIERAWLHQKYLYLRVNLGSWAATGGIVHNNQWAGYDPQDGVRPRSFDDFIRVLFALPGDEDSNANLGEILNSLGNSVGAYDFGLTYNHDEFTLSATRMFYLEDRVSTRFRSPWDGVWGINFRFKDRNQPLTAITYEHINTKNQDARSWELIGRRNYYNHFLYQSGWSYKGRSIGLPLMLFEDGAFVNNVLVAHHLGAEGEPIRNLRYRVRLTYSRNYGVQDDWVDEPGDSIPNDREDIVPLREFRTDQYSWSADFQYQPNRSQRWISQIRLSGDVGEVYEDRVGLQVGVVFRI